MGQPGMQSAPPPRSPNARVLPPSNEPGLWSADAPKASRASAEPPHLLGEELPVPTDARHITQFHAAMCAASLQEVADSETIRKIVERLRQQEKRCLALRMQSTCLKLVLESTSKAPVDIPAREKELVGLRDLWSATERAVGEACLGIAYGRGDMLRAYAATGDVWGKTVRIWWRYE